MSPIEILEKQIAKSALSTDDQKEFLMFLGKLPGRYIVDIIDMANEDQNFLQFLWSNYSKKEKAFVSNDDTLVEDVLKEEKIYLDEMNQSM